MHNQRVLQIVLAFWAACSLLFMAAMSIGLTLFALVSVFILWRERHAWQSSFVVLLKGNSFVWASLALVVVSVMSLVAAWLVPPLGLSLGGISEIKKFQYFLYPFLVAAVLWFLRSNISPKEWKFTHVMLVVALMASCAGVLQFWAPLFLPASVTSNYSFFRPLPTENGSGLVYHFHSQGFMQFHLSFAAVLFFPLSLVVAQIFWGELQTRQRLWRLAFALLMATAIFYTYSRTAWLALAVWFLSAALLWRPRVFALALLFLLMALGVLWTSDRSFQDRITDHGDSMDGRMIVWRASWEMVKDRPWTGVGFSKTGQYSEAYAEKLFGKKPWFSSHAHNNLLDALASTGVFGLCAFLAWWGVLFTYAWRAFRGNQAQAKIWGGAFLMAAVSFQVNGLTQVNFYDAKSQHTLVLWAGIILFFELERRLRAQVGRGPAA